MKKLTALLLLLPVIGFADPSPAIKYLMTDRLTMLEWGMFQMKMYLRDELILPLNYRNKDIGDSGAKITIHVNYDWEEDLITVNVLMGWGAFAADIEERCKQALELTRKSVKQSIIFAPWFEHRGFTPSNEPDDLLKDVASRVQLLCLGSIAPNKSVEVSSRLYSKDFSVTKREN